MSVAVATRLVAIPVRIVLFPIRLLLNLILIPVRWFLGVAGIAIIGGLLVSIFLLQDPDLAVRLLFSAVAWVIARSAIP